MLARDERAAVEQIEVDDLDDVAVVQARGNPRLVHEHQRDALVGDQLGPDDLDDDRPLEPVRTYDPGRVNLPHAAARKQPIDGIPAELRQHLATDDATGNSSSR